MLIELGEWCLGGLRGRKCILEKYSDSLGGSLGAVAEQVASNLQLLDFTLILLPVGSFKG